MFNGALNSLLANSGDDVIKSVAKSVVNNNADDFIAKFSKTTGDKLIDSRIKNIVNMSPDDYLKKAFEATDGKLGGSYDSWLSSNLVDPKTTASYAEAMKRGDEFPLAYIDNALGSQDGRNRALAVKLAGGKEMPVGIIPEMTNDEALKHYSDLISGTDSNYLKHTYQRKIDSIKKEIPEAAKQYLQPQNNGRLMAVHNLSPDKLAFSDELGGMAMPSIGVIDPNVGVIDGYGDITLVGSKNLIDPKLPGNRGRVFPNDMYSPRYPETKDIVNKMSEKELIKKLDDAGINRSRLDLEDIKYFGDQKPIQLLYGKEKGIDFDSLSFKDQQTIRDGAEYKSFVNDLKKNLVEARKFTTWDSNKGKAKLFDLNAENALKLMRKNAVAGGEGFSYGLGNVRAISSKPLNSIDDIINNSNRIVSSKDFEKVKSEMDTKLFSLIDEMSKYREDPTSWSNTDGVVNSISDYFTGKSDAFNYGYKTKPSPELLKKLDQFKDELANMATEYFEAKPNRVVGINEFNAAVIPKNTEQYVKDILQKNGITNLVEYDAAVENARQLALQNLKDLMF